MSDQLKELNALDNENSELKSKLKISCEKNSELEKQLAKSLEECKLERSKYEQVISDLNAKYLGSIEELKCARDRETNLSDLIKQRNIEIQVCREDMIKQIKYIEDKGEEWMANIQQLEEEIEGKEDILYI